MVQQVNLYQQAFRKERQKFSAAILFRATAVLAITLALLYGVFAWQALRQRNTLKELEAQQTALTAQVDDLNRKLAPRVKNKRLEQEIARAEGELATLGTLQQTLNQRVFTNTRGYSEYLIALARQHVAGLWLTGFDITGAGEWMRLEGRTVDAALVPRYVQRLGAEPPLANAEFEVFQMSRPEKDREKEKNPAPYVEFLLQTAATAAPKEAARP